MSRTTSARAGETRSGWLFVTPVVVILGLFLVAPILMAFWVSLSDWAGRGSPLSGAVTFVGGQNYTDLLGQDSLARSDFATSIRNNFYYVLLVVPLQTVLALGLALLLNQRRLKGLSFFRTSYYFPTVTSSVAIGSVFLFLFAGSGSVNALLKLVGVSGPNWFADPRGLLHLLLGAVGVGNGDEQGPAALTDHGFLSLSWWDWLAGPSVAMITIIALVIWVSAGAYMLMFLAALQNIPAEVFEAAAIDGASTWRRTVSVTIPLLRPTLFTVLTLGLIGTWQVFDQIYVMSKGNPSKTTLTPAYLAYDSSINQGAWGQGTAISFVLFAIILVMTGIQSWILRDRDKPRRRLGRAQRGGAGTGGDVGGYLATAGRQQR
ncbi:carbohydrate ABC transporter permease [Lapillicoccus jejuensis]|uniref:Carbohydrate ABC transporter membrane protein 1 (CUT1 family) n=1 Tax=Lapillicoccus jejuensis TaxID=402171 RepID=A0A542DVM1_9MICO|nr:sugar ABC transporter permease [Lapillicoccus jejuensis]TQJ07085.1 carbohydrate ABC transporter membrane protein 1 (CUT1 family) [Lapillicoccus jejuensis]